MSAVEEYEHMKQDRLGSEGPILADVIAMYADRAIDELEDTRDAALSLLEVAEAETDRLRTLFQKAKNAMTRAEAEIKDVKQERKELRTAIRNLSNDFNDLGERCGAAESALATEKAYAVGVEMAWQGTEIDSYREWLESAKDGDA